MFRKLWFIISSLPVNKFVFFHKHDLHLVYYNFKILIILSANIDKCYGYTLYIGYILWKQGFGVFFLQS